MKKYKERLLILLFSTVLQLIGPSVCSDTFNVVQVNPNVTVVESEDLYTLTMDENNHEFDSNNPTPLVKFENVSSVTLSQFIGDSFSYSIKPEADNENNVIMYSTQSFDYEAFQRNYVMLLLVNGINQVRLQLRIINIDDESPTMSCPRCSFDENTLYTVENSPCSCTVTDSDGWLGQMTFDVIDGTTKTESTLFLFDFREIPNDEETKGEVYIHLSSELDYEDISFYIFNVKAKDGASHPTIPEDTMVIVAVNDMRDTAPVWTKIIVFQQFEEQQEQEFTVSARDGDVGLNKNICYKKVQEDDEKANYINIDKDKGIIHVSKIDRDKNDIMMYQSQIEAYVCEEVDWNTTQDISFYIIDIDNNSPLVNWVVDYKNKNNSFDDETEKSTSLEFYENYAGSLNTTIFIRDIDTGENAQFTVELENSDTTTDVSFTNAFMVVPTAGYRSGEFQLNVRNATYLDYEDDKWRTIDFTVVSRGTKNASHIDRLFVHIELIDYNDEIPKFELNDYNVTISEATKKDVIITQVKATDRDAEDAVLAHSLIGSEYALRVIGIVSDTGELYVKIDNAFDYDTVNPIFIQVRATDKVGHTATVPLTIYLTDVNNKAPTIDGGYPISVEENQDKMFKLNSSITARDVDTNAELTVEIDWSTSYAIKNSRRLDMTNATIAREVKFLDVSSTGISEGEYKNRNILIELEVNDGPKYPAPDYELFDSLFLSLVVTDLNTDEEFMENKDVTAIIAISIIDINDNTPYFVESENENRTVQESAVKGTSPGSIIAIDLDVTDTVTYDCQALNPDADWLEINSRTGVFTVKDDDQISADTPPTFYFNYSCTASDDNMTHTSDPLEVRFYIIDRNNKYPQINIDDTVHVLEQPEDDAVVLDMRNQIKDEDRDVPFHTVVCQFSDVCNNKFYIMQNIIKVRKGKDIDRDTKEREFACSISCLDNTNGWRGEPSLSSQASLTIKVDDINNFVPELDMDDFDCYENLKKGEEVHVIIGKDLDAGDNGTIVFNVTSVINVDTGNDISVFEIHVDDNDYILNESHKRVHLMAAKDLRGYYGTYKITFGLSDKGVPQLSQLQERTFTIKRFNFESPSFVFPDTENPTVKLMSDQTLGSPLLIYREQSSLRNFEVTDDSNDDECSKWNIKFNITQIEPDGNTLFKLVDKEPCTSQLQINDAFNSETALKNIYQIQIFAWIDEEPSIDPEEASYFSNRNISFRFFDNYLQPTFDFREWIIKFVEGSDSQSEDLKERATYEDDDGTLNIYYFMVPGQNETIERIFEVDLETGKVSVRETFFYDFDEEFRFQIVASNDTQPSSTNANSYLDVIIRVQPANLRPPLWTREYFFGAIMPGFLSSTIVVSAEATDADVIDKDNLRYSINGTIQRHGKGLDSISTTNGFQIDPNTGNITLNFRVETTMSGYFSFEICVRDKEDDYHNGPHENCTTAYIFIITDDKTVDFRFYNNVTDVQTKEVEMLDIVSEIIEIQAYRQTIEILQMDGGEFSRATLYFINKTFTEQLSFNDRSLQEDSPVTAVDAQSILRIVSNVNTFSKLTSELRDQVQLMLMSFPSTNTTSENLEATLKAWLIGVAIVLGALCFALLITFIFKIKQLNRRISKLTEKKFGSQESGLNRLGITAPTTNKHAIEGSNPVFNSEIKKAKDMGDFDSQSIRSGDSDLIGVEDNPEFDYSFEENRNDITTYL